MQFLRLRILAELVSAARHALSLTMNDKQAQAHVFFIITKMTYSTWIVNLAKGMSRI